MDSVFRAVEHSENGQRVESLTEMVEDVPVIDRQVVAPSGVLDHVRIIGPRILCQGENGLTHAIDTAPGNQLHLAIRAVGHRKVEITMGNVGLHPHTPFAAVPAGSRPGSGGSAEGRLSNRHATRQGVPEGLENKGLLRALG